MFPYTTYFYPLPSRIMYVLYSGSGKRNLFLALFVLSKPQYKKMILYTSTLRNIINFGKRKGNVEPVHKCYTRKSFAAEDITNLSAVILNMTERVASDSGYFTSS